MFLKVLFVSHLFYTSSIGGESLEEMSPFMYSFTGNAVNFNDIFPYTNSLAGADTAPPPDVKDDVYNLRMVPSRLVEFHIRRSTETYTATATATPNVQNTKTSTPRTNTAKGDSPYNILTKETDSGTKDFVQNYFRKSFGPDSLTAPTIRRYAPDVKITTNRKPTTTTSTTTTSAPSTTTTQAPYRERGVLDLLFPAKRVSSFKHIFDSVRNILSYTFKR